MPILAKKIIFPHKAHFDLDGYINKQNCSIWGSENPHAYIEEPYNQNESLFGEDWAVTVYGDRCRAMLNEFLFTKFEEKDIGNICFQQDGATCHTTEARLYPAI